MSRALALVILIGVLNSASIGLIGPVYPIFVTNRLAGSLSDVGLLYAVFYLSSAFLKIVTGKFSDIYGRHKIFLFGAFLGAIATFGYTLASNIAHLFILEFLNGTAFAFERPALIALTVDLSKPENLGFSVGLLDSFTDLIIALTSLLVAIVVGLFDIDYLFYLCSGLQAMSGFLVIRK
ncbi:MAG: MFS transporter [Nitrososphaerales archaeon]